MKTSKSQQNQTQRKILAAAISLMTAHGYEKTTMKEIAREAGIGDATIYKYFPSKEKLLLGFFEASVKTALADTLATPDLADYGLQERLQRLLDAMLDVLRPERGFVQICREVIGNSPLLIMRDQIPGHAEMKAQILVFLEQAEEQGEIVPFDFKPVLASLMMDYVLVLVLYWLKDESKQEADTTQLIDLTLEILLLVLQSGIINKFTELLSFMLRNQMARILRSGMNGTGLLDLLKIAKKGLGA